MNFFTCIGSSTKYTLNDFTSKRERERKRNKAREREGGEKREWLDKRGNFFYRFS